MVIGEQAESRKKKMNKVVKRLVFLMFAYAAITTLAYVPICAVLQHSKLLEYHVKQYFGCLMFHPPDHCPKSKYLRPTFFNTFFVNNMATFLASTKLSSEKTTLKELC